MHKLIASLFIVACGLSHALAIDADETNAFSRIRPELKRAIPVELRVSPFPAAENSEKASPVLSRRDDPTVLVQERLGSRVQSVIRGASPLILVKDRVFQPGDEILIGKEPAVPRYRTILKAVNESRINVCMLSLDTENPGQVEAIVSVRTPLSHR